MSKSYTPGLVTAHALLKMDSRALEHLQFMQKSLLHIFHYYLVLQAKWILIIWKYEFWLEYDREIIVILTHWVLNGILWFCPLLVITEFQLVTTHNYLVNLKSYYDIYLSIFLKQSSLSRGFLQLHHKIANEINL